MDEQNRQELTFRQLEIFWTVVHAGSLTRAAKQLEMRQPSISQQLSRMESRLGGKLIRFVNNELTLTPAGQFLLEQAGGILAAVDRAKVGVAEHFEGRRGRLVVGALPSLARVLLVPAFARLLADRTGFFVDIVEMTPREAIEQLQGRTIDLALISGYAASTRLSTGLKSVHLTEDDQFLAVPPGLPDLSAVADPEAELDPEQCAILNSTIRYAFASEHSVRLNNWYELLLPGSRMIARCRSFECALSFVESGLGSAIVPEFAVQHRGNTLFDVGLYRLPVRRREIVLVMPDHYLGLPLLRGFVTMLEDAAATLRRIAARPIPAFALRRLQPDSAPSAEPGAAKPEPHRTSL